MLNAHTQRKQNWILFTQLKQNARANTASFALQTHTLKDASLVLDQQRDTNKNDFFDTLVSSLLLFLIDAEYIIVVPRFFF